MSLQNLSENLKSFRLLLGLNQDEIAKLAGITRLAYLNIEKGLSEPRSGTLFKLAEVLGVGVAELVAERKLPASVRFRANKAKTKKEETARSVTLIKLIEWLKKYNELEDSLKLPRNFKFESISTANPVDAAKECREIMGYDSSEPIYDICGLIEKTGIKLYLYESPIKDNFGACVNEADGGPAIAVNTLVCKNYERRIFTVAHELGHLILHKNSFKENVFEENDAEEREANLFASHFLMPQQEFRKKWNETSALTLVDRILTVKTYFKVSYKTVIQRMRELGKFDDTIYRKFSIMYKNIYSRDLKNHFEPEAITKYNFSSDRFQRVVKDAFRKNLITKDYTAKLLGYDDEYMKILFESWELDI